MSDDELKQFYGTDNYRKTRPEAYAKNNIDEMPRARRVAMLVYRGRNHLDVGCARGFTLLNTLSKGFDILGVEPNPDYPLPNIPTVRSLDEVTGLWDNITCIHVLEHVSDFKGMAEKMVDLLAPGGMLNVEVPNEYSIGGALSKAHLSYFKPEVLMRLFAGLTLESQQMKPYTIMVFRKEVANA